jgi:hypothetical protein
MADLDGKVRRYEEFVNEKLRADLGCVRGSGAEGLGPAGNARGTGSDAGRGGAGGAMGLRAKLSNGHFLPPARGCRPARQSASPQSLATLAAAAAG